MPDSIDISPELRAVFFRYDRHLPLEPEERTVEERQGVRRLHFRITSIHGERVPGHLWLPPGDGPHAVVMLQHGAGGSKDDAYISLPAQRWARDGCATVAIDAYQHGERAPGGEPPPWDWTLPWRRRDHIIQMAVDLMRVVDYLGTRPEIDAARIGYAGFSMGTFVGVPFVALDRRVKAAVFCLGGSFLGGPVDAEVRARPQQDLPAALTDPAGFAPLIAPRPVLMINGSRDEVVPPEAGRRLFGALAEPKEIVWFDGGHTDLTGAHFKPCGSSYGSRCELRRELPAAAPYARIAV